MKSNVILVGVDASPRAALVLAAANDLAQRYGAALHVVRGVEPARDVPTEEPLASDDGRLEAMTLAAQRELDALLATLPAGTDARSEVRVGLPADVLVAAAAELRPRFLVIGTHGHTAWKRVLGTTAARVLEAASCSVFAVRVSNEAGAA